MATCIKANGKTIWPMEQAYLLIRQVQLMMASGLMICSMGLVKSPGRQVRSSSKEITSKVVRKDKESMNGQTALITKVSLRIAASTATEFIILRKVKSHLKGTLKTINLKARVS